MRDLLAFGQPPRQHGPRPLLRTMVGDVLRRTRLSQGRTLADVAAAARISMQYLSELERGRKEASSEILAALCTALRLDLSDLLAAVGRELLARRGSHRTHVVRLDTFRQGAAGSERDGSQMRAPRFPADGSTAPDLSVSDEVTPDERYGQPAGILPVKTTPTAPVPAPTAPVPASPARTSGDPVCRLAA